MQLLQLYPPKIRREANTLIIDTVLLLTNHHSSIGAFAIVVRDSNEVRATFEGRMEDNIFRGDRERGRGCRCGESDAAYLRTYQRRRRGRMQL